MTQNPQSHPRQQGIASIVITMITMVVISLIVLGFATISRREQRQALDQQLSTQAFYAAESGIQDASSVIKTALSTPGHTVKAKRNCTTNDPGPGDDYPTPTSGLGNQTKISSQYNVSYTCLTVDDTPSSLKFNGVGENSVVIPVTVDPAGAPITSVTVSWTPTAVPSGSTASCPATVASSLRAQASWNCGYGMLRADLTLTDGALTRAGLAGNSISSFFEPLSNNPGSGTVDFGSNKGNPNLLAAQCSQGSYTTASSCTATIKGITGNSHSLSLRLSSLYQPSNLVVAAFSGGSALPVVGVQATIDATGKAQDVLRRIQVRLPVVQTGGLLPSFALQSSASICKRFTTTNGYFAVDGNIIDPDPSNSMCDGSISDGDLSNANAGLSSPCDSSCTPGWVPPPGGKYKYAKVFTNQSNNVPSDVTGCTWDFGDGTTVKDNACQFNDTISHTYPTLSPEPAYPAACLSQHYVTTLTVQLRSGATATKSHGFAMPLCV